MKKFGTGTGRVLGTFMLILMASQARADEQMTPLAISGSWVAMAHRESMVSAPDVCTAFNIESHVSFRAADDGVEFRVWDDSWSLPADVHGVVKVTIGSDVFPIQIDSNTDKMVGGSIEGGTVPQIFSAMDHASTMSVVAGSAKPKVVSLAGSTKVTNAFRTCANIGGGAPDSGANPFKSP